MITTPPTRWTTDSAGSSEWPTKPAATPNAANTDAKPRMKIIVAGTTLAMSWDSTDSPTMIPK